MGEDRHAQAIGEHDAHRARRLPAAAGDRRARAARGLVRARHRDGAGRARGRIVVRVGETRCSQTGRSAAAASRCASRCRRGDAMVRVTTVDGRGTPLDDVGRPRLRAARRAARPRVVAPRLDPAARRAPSASSTRGSAATAASTSRTSRSGCGAAWNAAARFPAASTLKLAIAVAVLRWHDGKPAGHGSRGARSAACSSCSRQRGRERARGLARRLDRGRLARVDETLRALGLNDSLMYGGYEDERGGRRPPGADPDPGREPAVVPARQVHDARGTSPGSRVRVYLARRGQGAAARVSASPASEARYLLWLLAQSQRPRQARPLPRRRRRSCCTRRAGCRRCGTTPASCVWHGRRRSSPAVMTWESRGVGDELAGTSLAGSVHARSRFERSGRASTDSGRRPRARGAPPSRRRSARCAASRAGR